MTDRSKVAELMVQTHPSGKWTLTEKVPSGLAVQIDQPGLIANPDRGDFYRAVAHHMAALSMRGVTFQFTDMD